MLPGQSLVEGSGVTGAPLSQLPGSPFSVTVYATDAAYNIATLEVATVSVTDSDPAATTDGPQPLAGGSASFSITNQTAGLWDVTPAGGPGTQQVSDVLLRRRADHHGGRRRRGREHRRRWAGGGGVDRAAVQRRE